MKLATFTHHDSKGWSGAFPTELDSESTVVFVFGAPGYVDAPAAMDELVAAFPRSHVVGCSSAGEIFGARVNDQSLSVAVARFERGRVREASTGIVGGGSSREAGEALARELSAPDLRAMFVLSDGLAANGTELLRGIHSVVAGDVTVTGGLAGDGTAFKRTWVLAGGKAAPGRVVAIGLYGEGVGVSHGSRGGWDTFGTERVVTRSEGNVVYELDGEPALALYKKYLGDRASGLPSTALLFPLALRTSSDDTNMVVRTILAVDEEKQSMTFAGDVAQESVVQLMRANFDRLIDGAAQASLSAARPGEGDTLSIAISCVGRRIVLGERTEEEVEAAVEGAPDPRLVGFYSYGEISPLVKGACGVLHNQTMTLTRFWEI
ncbi:MAG: FIST N-terminal domain-containing protein [Labilithrix sp.]